jgi:hypothetical protein
MKNVAEVAESVLGRPLTWQEILVGLKRAEIDADDIRSIAIERAAYYAARNNDIPQEVIDLTLTGSHLTHEVEMAIENLIENNFELQIFQHNPLDTWRLLRLEATRKSFGKTRMFLDQVAEIYSDFDYPEDMENCVYYMPLKTNQTGEDTLYNNCDKLIVDLRKRIMAECVSAPPPPPRPDPGKQGDHGQ